MKAKTPYLVVLASSSQLYSGTGTALFEWIRFAKDRFDFSLCIDNKFPLNYRIARDFCLAEGLQFLPSAPQAWEGGADPGNAMASLHVGSGHWPLVEFVSWANTTVNLQVVEARPAGVKLIYTPHTQPAWTMPGAERFWGLERGFDQMLEESDLVCCDSPAEVQTLTQRHANTKAVYIPIGVDTQRFSIGPPDRHPTILVVADFNEIRKRTDLSLGAIHRSLQHRPTLKAVLAGRNSDKVQVARQNATRIEQRGFISDAELVSLYQQSSVFLLLSDYEAFGIPIVEALCCGTPVVTTRTREAASLFEGLPGCFLVDNTDTTAVDRAIDQAFAREDRGAVARAAADRFSLERTFTLKLRAIQQLLGQDGTS